MSSYYETYFHSPDLIQARREYPNSIRLQQPAFKGNQMTVEEAMYILGKNILGKNVTDRLFPVVKTFAKVTRMSTLTQTELQKNRHRVVGKVW